MKNAVCIIFVFIFAFTSMIFSGYVFLQDKMSNGYWEAQKDQIVNQGDNEWNVYLERNADIVLGGN